MESNNMKAMREALVALSAWAKVVKDNPKDKTAIECAEFVEVAVKEALAELPRNCDVGTAGEQLLRFRDYCLKSRHKDCMFCHNPPINLMRCCLSWAQMPYEEGGKK